MDSEQIGYIVKAYKLALEKYDGRKTISGGLYMLKLIEMADIAINEIGLRSKTIVGIFLHGITSESDVTIDYIKEHFGTNKWFGYFITIPQIKTNTHILSLSKCSYTNTD